MISAKEFESRGLGGKFEKPRDVSLIILEKKEKGREEESILRKGGKRSEYAF